MKGINGETMSSIEYVVKEGDTLSEILYDLTGDGTYENFTRYASENGITDPDHIVPGQVLTIPIADITNSEVLQNYASTTSGDTSNSTVTGATSGVNTGSSSTISSGNVNSTSSVNTSYSGSNTSSSWLGSTTTNTVTSSSSNSSLNPSTPSVSSSNSASSNNSIYQGSSSSSNSATNNKAITQNATSNLSASVSSSATGFSYFSEDDCITYDLDAALIKLQAFQDSISQVSYATDDLIESLNDLQGNAHDKQGSVIVEAFVDFEYLIGDPYEGTGVVGFIKDTANLSDEMGEYLTELQNRTLY